jgi:hypothetical protein
MLGVEKRVGDTDIFDCALIVFLESYLVHFMHDAFCVYHLSPNICGPSNEYWRSFLSYCAK